MTPIERLHNITGPATTAVLRGCLQLPGITEEPINEAFVTLGQQAFFSLASECQLDEVTTEKCLDLITADIKANSDIGGQA